MKKWMLTVLMLMTIIALSACGNSAGKSEDASGDAEEGGSGGDEYEETTIRLAYNLPQDHHISIGVENFAKEITEKSGGNVQVEVYPAGQLLDDKDMNDSLLSGGVEMGVNSSTIWSSTVPVMGVFDVPYTFNDYEDVGNALKGDFGEKLNDAMEEKGAKVIMFADYGYVQFANNKKQLKSPDDFKGLKIRSIGDLPSELIKAYGASPVFMGGGEVYMALQRNTVDGATSGTTAMSQRKYDEVAKYLTINNYAYLEFIVAMNKNFWDNLEPKLRNLLQRLLLKQRTGSVNKQKLRMINMQKDLEEKGMDVYVVPEEDLDEWKEKAEPVKDIFIKNAGEPGKELLDLVDEE